MLNGVIKSPVWLQILCKHLNGYCTDLLCNASIVYPSYICVHELKHPLISAALSVTDLGKEEVEVGFLDIWCNTT